MAHDNTPYGLAPWGPVLQTMRYNVRGNDNDPIFVGDVCGQDTDGYITGSLAGGGTNICGASLTFLTGGVTGTALVACDPDQLFHGQDSTAGSLTIASIGYNIDHLYGFGSFVTKRSGTRTASQVPAAVATTAGFRLHGYRRNINTDGTPNGPGTNPDANWGQYVKVIVQTNEHIGKVATGY